MLNRTPLFDLYKEYGGKTIDFGGWELPVQFSSIKKNTRLSELQPVCLMYLIWEKSKCQGTTVCLFAKIDDK